MSEVRGWRPRRESTALLVVDLQEKLLPVMLDAEDVVERTRMMVLGARALGISVLATEQTPQKLGPTLAALRDEFPAPPLEKRTFSCFGAEGLVEQLEARGIETLVLAGIETHICVQATALDALKANLRVLVARDAVTSRRVATRAAGLARMGESGALSTSAEGFLYEFMRDCDDPAFREILALVREAR